MARFLHIVWLKILKECYEKVYFVIGGYDAVFL